MILLGPQAKECWQPPKAARHREQLPHPTPEPQEGPWYPENLTFNPVNEIFRFLASRAEKEKYTYVTLNHTVCGNLLHQP